MARGELGSPSLYARLVLTVSTSVFQTEGGSSNLLSCSKIGEYLLILADFYFPMGFVNVINAVSPTVANRKE